MPSQNDSRPKGSHKAQSNYLAASAAQISPALLFRDILNLLVFELSTLGRLSRTIVDSCLPTGYFLVIVGFGISEESSQTDVSPNDVISISFSTVVKLVLMWSNIIIYICLILLFSYVFYNIYPTSIPKIYITKFRTN